MVNIILVIVIAFTVPSSFSFDDGKDVTIKNTRLETEYRVFFRPLPVQFLEGLQDGISGWCEVSSKLVTVVLPSNCLMVRLPNSNLSYYFVFGDGGNPMRPKGIEQIFRQNMDGKVEFLYSENSI